MRQHIAPSVCAEMPRTFDPALVNAVCAQPGMPIWCGTPEQPIDLSAAVFNRANCFFIGSGGFFGAIWRGGGLYEVHVAFGPRCRGARAAAAIRNCMGRMFAGSADSLLAVAPESHRACRYLASRVGFVRVPGALGTLQGEPLIPYVISRMMWFRSVECRQP